MVEFVACMALVVAVQGSVAMSKREAKRGGQAEAGDRGLFWKQEGGEERWRGRKIGCWQELGGNGERKWDVIEGGRIFCREARAVF